MLKLLFHIAIIITLCLNIAHAQTIDISSVKNFEVINRHISITNSANKKIIHLDAAEGAGVAWINHTYFSSGTIEFDVKGKDIMQQSFVGIAFHGINDSSFDAIYFRPFNFQSKDTVRKNHSVQYICMPKYDWSYLRETFPGKYESALKKSVEPSGWFHAKIVIDVKSIKVFVNNDSKPSLVVQPLVDYSAGRIGFWTGNNPDGDFSNLTIQQN